MDAQGVLQDQSDALVVTMNVTGVQIHRTLVDNGSSVNVLYYQTLRQMAIEDKYLQPYPRKLQGFSGDTVEARGQIVLSVEFGEPPCQRRILADFIVVDIPSNYNAILGRPLLHELQAATSIYHYCLKFPTPSGPGIIRGNRDEARACNVDLPRPLVGVLKGQHWERDGMPRPEVDVTRSIDSCTDLLDPRLKVRGGEPVEELDAIKVSTDIPPKELKIGHDLQPPVRDQLISFLRGNLDVFAWEHADMKGIN
jgi:hypothetical protein